MVNLTGKWHGIGAEHQAWLDERKSEKITDGQYWMQVYDMLFESLLPKHPCKYTY
jgi:hypothetical protein